MQPETNRTVSAGHQVRLQVLRVGTLHRLAGIVVCSSLPGEDPVFGRQGRRRDADHPFRSGDGKKKPRLSPREGGTRQCRENLHTRVHPDLPLPCRSRRMASTAAMRSPIQRMTGTAIELPSAL